MTAFTAVIASPFICLSIAHGCTRADLLRSALFLCTLPLFSTGRLLICYTGTIIQRRRIRHEAQQYPSAVQLEERYGSRTLLSGILMTALVSGMELHQIARGLALAVEAVVENERDLTVNR